MDTKTSRGEDHSELSAATYLRRPGSDDSGRDYEIKITALLALRCATMKHMKDIWLGSNVDQVGDFDDIVLCTQSSDDKHTAYLIQLKHQEKPKNITHQNFTYSDGRSKGEGKREKFKSDFSLAKYSTAYLELMKRIDGSMKDDTEIVRYLRKADRRVFVLFSNKAVDKCGFLLNIEETALSFLNTSSVEGCIYKFDYLKLGFDQGFLRQLILFSDQVHISEADNLIRQEIVKICGSLKLGNLQGVVDKFLAFINGWVKNISVEKTCYALTKCDIINKLVDLFLEPYKIDFSKEPYLYHVTPQEHIWADVSHDKSITVVDLDDTILDFLKRYIGCTVRQYCIEDKTSWLDHLSRNAQKKLYQDHSDLRLVHRHEEITLFDIYQCLWTTAQVPLLLHVKKLQDLQIVNRCIDLSKNLRVIVVKTEELKIKKGRIFATLDDLSDEAKSKILDQPVRFQGRTPGELRNYIDKTMFKHVQSKDIIHILLGRFNIGYEYESLAHNLAGCFIPRSLLKIVLKPEILTEIKEENFIIDDDEEKPTNKTVHHLIFNDNLLEWKDSSGSVENVLKYQLIDPNDLYTSRCMINSNTDFAQNIDCLWRDLDVNLNEALSNSRSCLISAGPGMGKSVIMDFIAVQAPTSVWVVKILLSDHEEFHESLKDQDLAAADYLNYFNDALIVNQTCTNPELSKRVFQKFVRAKKIVVLLDGFDEISIFYEDEVTKLAKCLRKAGYGVWITTRPLMKPRLETELELISTTLRPFTRRDQEAFLIKYFTQVTSGDHELIEEFVLQLLEVARLNLNDKDCEFTGVPLQTKLLADVFSKELKRSLDERVITLNTKFNLLFLYEQFIRQKTDILCDKFGKDAKRTRALLVKHQQLFALKIIFRKDFLLELNLDEQLQQYYQDDRGDQTILLQREGIVVVEAKPRLKISFVHRTFAEYLAAQWLSENFNNKSEKTKEVVRVLIKIRFDSFLYRFYYKFLFTVFDGLLARNCPLHNAIINGNDVGELMESQPEDLDMVDKAGRSVLHLIALYGFAHTSESETVDDFLADLIDNVPGDQILNGEDNLLGYNPLDYAFSSKSLAVANKLCEKFLRLTTTIDICYNYHGLNSDPDYHHTYKYLHYNLYKKLYFTYCTTLNYHALFSRLLLYFAGQDILLQRIDKDTTVKSYCNNHTGATNTTISAYAQEFNRKTIRELFCQPKTSHYNDLQFAAAFGTKSNMLHLLSTKEIDVNAQDIHLNTPLHYALNHRRLENVQTLLVNDAKICIENQCGETALHCAVTNGIDEFVLDLLAQGVDINKTNHFGDTPLILALKNTQIATAEILIDSNVNALNLDHQSALHYAIHAYHLVLKLIQRNANVDQQNHNGETPLLLALSHNQVCTAKLLISNNADVNLSNKSGEAALHLSVKLPNDDVLLELLAKNAVVDKQDDFGNTALHIAIMERRFTAATKLLAHGSNVHLTNRNGFSPLHHAATRGDEGIIKDLLDRRAKIDQRNNIKDTPLLIALKNRHLDIAKLLVSKGANIAAEDINGTSCLHHAAEAVLCCAVILCFSFCRNRPK